MMDKDTELYLEIDDDFKRIPFDSNTAYPYHDGDLTNKIRISVSDEAGIIAYMDCFVFYDERIAESRYDHVFLSDDMTQDAHEAMGLLKKLKLLKPSKENQTIGELLTRYTGVTVYLHHIAVREDYRRNGIGNWLLHNLSPILQRNYSVFPRQIITLLSPQEIKWNAPTPSSEPIFRDPEDGTAENTEMYNLMTKMFEKNGYERYKNTKYYISRCGI